jgi:hypothetical protein
MVRVEAAAGALFFGCHDALSSPDAGAALGSERTGAAYTKKKTIHHMYIVQTEPVPIIYLYCTQRYVYCYVYDCMYLS